MSRLEFRRRAIRNRRWILNLVLFSATVVTTTLVGALHAGRMTDSWPVFLARGFIFSIPLMAILSVHELGHYLTGRIRGLDVTPPYFIPGFLPIGTFGAFIKIRSAITNRRVLMEIGAMGPLCGSLVAIPLLLVGLQMSSFFPEATPSADGWTMGTSLILEFFCLLTFGQFSVHAHVVLHPTAVAAWYGLFITALNLLPMGQLDGGHVVYALFGPRAAKITSYACMCCLIPMGLLLWPGWLVFGLLVTLLGLGHPPPLDPVTPLDRTGRIIGGLALAVFVTTFIPVPLSLGE
ncbi:MAG: site-2 protease family protein [Thermodesulfobacteriota bacterium]